MDDLAGFLLARIAEDEGAARGALDWHTFRSPKTRQFVENVDRTNGGYSAARVLAECDAKRHIVELHRSFEADDCDGDYIRWPCPTLRLLALPHADHPDYRQEWKP